MLEKGLEGATPTEAREVRSRLARITKGLQIARRAKGYTQEGLAEKLNVNVNTIKYIEQGRRIPSLPMLLRIAIALSVNIELD